MNNVSIIKMEKTDLEACAKIMMSVYNNEHWQCNWTVETALTYLTDYFECKKFVGYVLRNEGEIIGGIFCHEKVWWNNDEVFIDEMFIHPDFQRSGYGKLLLEAVGEYIAEHKLAGFTLTTNRYTPAPAFYRKNGFSDAEHVLFMYKEVAL